MKRNKDGARRNVGPIPNYKAKPKAQEIHEDFNPSKTHRVSTKIREAFDRSVRLLGRNTHAIPDVALKVSDSLHANNGLFRQLDVTINVMGKTYKRLHAQGIM